MSPFPPRSMALAADDPCALSLVLLATRLTVVLGEDKTAPAAAAAPLTQPSARRRRAHSGHRRNVRRPRRRPFLRRIVIGPNGVSRATAATPAKPVEPCAARDYRDGSNGDDLSAVRPSVGGCRAIRKEHCARAKETLPKDDLDIGMLMGRLGGVYITKPNNSIRRFHNLPDLLPSSASICRDTIPTSRLS